MISHMTTFSPFNKIKCKLTPIFKKDTVKKNMQMHNMIFRNKKTNVVL